MKYFLLFLPFFLTAQPQWQNFNTGSSASLRGIAAVSENTCWASGSAGTVLLTHDGGKRWREVSPTGFEDHDFRDIEAFDDSTAIIMAVASPAIFLKTTDAGQSWREVYRNEREGIFFDAMDFWDSQRGMAFSDAPVDKLVVVKTTNGGDSWQEIPRANLPSVAYRQGGFAASGSCLATFGDSSVIIGLGGAEATILLSQDGGASWTKSPAPIDHGNFSQGIFGFAFSDSLNGFCVGGDYQADSLSEYTMARTHDGGLSWKPVLHSAVAGKYRSAIAYLTADTLVAISRTGCNYSFDGGQSWENCEGEFYSLSVAGKTIWASGNKGAVARWKF